MSDFINPLEQLSDFFEGLSTMRVWEKIEPATNGVEKIEKMIEAAETKAAAAASELGAETLSTTVDRDTAEAEGKQTQIHETRQKLDDVAQAQRLIREAFADVDIQKYEAKFKELDDNNTSQGEPA